MISDFEIYIIFMLYICFFSAFLKYLKNCKRFLNLLWKGHELSIKELIMK